jgi:hypothetical protein
VRGDARKVLRTIQYRIAVKRDLARIEAYLELRVRAESDYRWNDYQGAPQRQGGERNREHGEHGARDKPCTFNRAFKQHLSCCARARARSFSQWHIRRWLPSYN